MKKIWDKEHLKVLEVCERDKEFLDYQPQFWITH